MRKGRTLPKLLVSCVVYVSVAENKSLSSLEKEEGSRAQNYTC